MKLVKTQICLYIYEELLNNGSISGEKIKRRFNLEDKTFSRYINEIRAYLSNFYKGSAIIYNKDKQRYYLIANVGSV